MSGSRLKIMIVDENEQRGLALAAVLRELDYQVVGRVTAGDYLPTRVLESKPDVVLIDLGSPSRDTLEQLSILHRDDPRPVVMFAKDEDAATIQAAVRAGVSAYVVDGLSGARVRPIIDTAVAHFNSFQGLRHELERTRNSLAERKAVDRAKGVLMKEQAIDEEVAFAQLRRMAMDSKCRIGEVAEEIIRRHEAGANRHPSANGRHAS